jgi:tRNA (cytidine/uridine-2'-O-)-methyltransferase
VNVVLVEPEIPPNTGNIARLCAATNVRLHLIEPLGFELSDRTLKRAGMDYWNHLDWRTWASWDSFQWERTKTGRLWFVESGGPVRYDQADFGPEDYLVFGRETAGLPGSLVESNRDRWLRIPMMNPNSRSLNLGNCVALVLFEAMRQNGFAGERLEP